MSIENLFRPLDGGRFQVLGGLTPAVYGSGEPNRTAKVSNETVGPDQNKFKELLDNLEASKSSGDQAKSSSNAEKRKELEDILGVISDKDSRYQTLQEQRNALIKDQFTPTADLSQFEGLLGKLEASKMKQAGSAALDTRRNTYAQGLAQMMSNF